MAAWILAQLSDWRHIHQQGCLPSGYLMRMMATQMANTVATWQSLESAALHENIRLHTATPPAPLGSLTDSCSDLCWWQLREVNAFSSQNALCLSLNHWDPWVQHHSGSASIVCSRWLALVVCIFMLATNMNGILTAEEVPVVLRLPTVKPPSMFAGGRVPSFITSVVSNDCGQNLCTMQPLCICLCWGLSLLLTTAAVSGWLLLTSCHTIILEAGPCQQPDSYCRLLLRVSSYSTTTAMVFWAGPCWWPASYISASADHPPYYDCLQIFPLLWLDLTIPVTMQRFSSLRCIKTYLMTEQHLNNILLLHAHKMTDAVNLTEIAHLCPLMQNRLNFFGNFVLFCV